MHQFLLARNVDHILDVDASDSDERDDAGDDDATKVRKHLKRQLRAHMRREREKKELTVERLRRVGARKQRMAAREVRAITFSRLSIITRVCDQPLSLVFFLSFPFLFLPLPHLTFS
jgi:tRNA C32,U32 (ribose-2'-O)-methylase TrmJ